MLNILQMGVFKLKILVTMPAGSVRDTFFTQDVCRRFAELGEVRYNETDKQFTDDELADQLRGVDFCVTGWGTHKLSKDVLRYADRLKLVAHTAGSVYGIVDGDVYEAGARVVGANRLFAESTAEGAFTYILCGLRRIEYYTGRVRNGQWKEVDFQNQGLLDKKVGLVGFGQVARNLYNYMKPLRAQVSVCSPEVDEAMASEYGVKRTNMEELFSTCDVISIHAALGEGTYHIVTEKLLRMMGPGTLLVNSARGAIIDEEALALVLREGKISAVLDVTEQEPLPLDSPLRGLENVTLIPHMGGPTIDRRRFCALAMADEIERFQKGEPLQHEISLAYAMTMTHPFNPVKK